MQSDIPDFSTLIQKAAALKTFSQAPFRKKFDSFPIWYQNSIFSQKDLISIRNSKDITQSIEFSMNCKNNGNDLYKSKKFLEATVSYTNALSVFNWLTPLDENWRHKDIDDEKLREEYLEVSDPESAGLS